MTNPDPGSGPPPLRRPIGGLEAIGRHARGLLQRRGWVAVVIVAVAVALRMLGITHDLPFSFYGDEAHFVKRAVAFGSGDLNPHWFHKPAGFMYLLFFEYGLFYLAGRVMGAFHQVGDFIALFINDRSAFYLIGRATTLVFGAGCVALTYIIGRRAFGAGSGLLAAALLAVCTPHVAASQVVKADIPSSFFVLLSLYFLLMTPRARRPVFRLCWAGVFAGIGMGMKLYALPLVPLFWLAALARVGEPGRLRRILVDPRPWLATGLFVVAFFAVSPYDFIDPNGFVRHTVSERVNQLMAPEAAFDPDTGVEFSTGPESLLPAFGQYVEALAAKGSMGPYHTLLAAAGLLVLGFGMGGRAAWLLAGYVGLYTAFAVLGAPFHVQPRHLIPIYPVFYIFEATALVAALIWFKDRVPIPVLVPAAVVVAVMLVPALLTTVQKGVVNGREDTRNLAREWVHANIPEGTGIVLDEDGPELAMTREQLNQLVAQAEAAAKGPFTTHAGTYYRHLLEHQTGPSYQLTPIHHLWWRAESTGYGTTHLTGEVDADMGNPLKARGVAPLYKYLADGNEYVILNDGRTHKYLNTPRGRRFPEFVHFYQEVADTGQLVAEFDPGDGRHPGPTVRIYRFPKRGAG